MIFSVSNFFLRRGLLLVLLSPFVFLRLRGFGGTTGWLRVGESNAGE